MPRFNSLLEVVRIHRALDDLGMIEFAQLGKSRPFGDQQTQQLMRGGISDQRFVSYCEKASQQRGGRALGVIELIFEKCPVG